MNLLTSWFRRTFADPQVVILGIVLVVGVAVVVGLGRMLAPVFASIVIAYLLEAAVVQLQRDRVTETCICYAGFPAFPHQSVLSSIWPGANADPPVNPVGAANSQLH